MNSATLEELQRRITQLEGQINLGRIEKLEEVAYGWEEKFTPPTCYWDCVLMDSIDPGATDWEGEFFADSYTTSTATERVAFRIATAGGELNLAHPHGSTSHCARFAKIIVNALQPCTVRCGASFVGAGSDVQRKLNGTITAMAGPNDFYFDLEFIEGDNVLCFSLDLLTQGFQFWGRIIDGDQLRWVDPNGARNPMRQGYAEFGSGGGVGSTPGGFIEVPPSGSGSGP